MSSCQYYIKSKNRTCLKKPLDGHLFCHIHKNKYQKGGSGDRKYNSPYALISSELPPNPQQQSWYHHQAPVYQSFGDYLCIKKSFLKNAKNIINEIFTE